MRSAHPGRRAARRCARRALVPHHGQSRLIIRHAGDTHRCPSLRSGLMKRQADLTKRRAVDLCRVAAMLCRTV
ncbi:hypothetical protein CJI59_29390 [Streptomyces sp. Alain-F2R5]|nr:hypothetical protein CJI59_29390 [Streptomyces sp. Alain-F2R5]